MSGKYDEILEGQSPTDIAIQAMVTRQTVYNYARMKMEGKENGPGRVSSRRIEMAIEELKKQEDEN